MKQLHRSDLLGWSRFDEARNLDFHSVCIRRESGNILVDPLPLSAHDEAHLEQMGGAQWIVVTNSDHLRATEEIARRFSAKVAGPAQEQVGFPIRCDRWLDNGDELANSVKVFALNGSKTPGELALLVGEHTLIVGDLIRGHVGGVLNILPDAKLADREKALASVARLAEIGTVRAVLVGDGWPVFRDGAAQLRSIIAN